MSWSMNMLLAQVSSQEPVTHWSITPLVALAVIVLSVLLGNYLGKMLRMPDHGWKISLCLFSFLASAAVLVMGPVLGMGPQLKLGVDLRGGVILVYKVDRSKLAADQKVDMDELIKSIKRRVNPGGQKEVIVRQRGADQVEIVIPEIGEAEVNRVKRVISRTGSLEFRILANTRDNKDLMDLALTAPNRDRVLDRTGRELARWVPVVSGEEHSIKSYPEIATRPKRGEPKITEVLIVPDNYDVTGAYLTRATSGTDRQGKPCVNFMFSPRGGRLFGELTASHLPDKLGNFTYKLGVVLDGELYSAPSIQSTIYDSGEITGSFTNETVNDLVNVLNAGSLPATLEKEPISECRSDATLGADTIAAGLKAMIISSILVPLFMIVYYHFCGVVAVIALILNMMILFAVMIAFKAAFTLTGFAGLALTVGMAVDNNVLLYERLREEMSRGATLRMALRNAFHRAGATIIDCNLTHLIAAIVLFYLGSDQLRGFALTLGIGVVTSMFTAVFVSHVIFDVAERRRWTSASMLRLIGHTNIDFMRLAPYCVAASILLSVVAIGVSVHRGKGLFDIDFTGGASVQVLFDKPQDTGEVRKRLAGLPKREQLPDLAISGATQKDEQQGLRFNINTSEMNGQKVAAALLAAFGDRLAHNAVKATEPKTIADAQKTDTKAADAQTPVTSDPLAGGSQMQLKFHLPLEQVGVKQLVETSLEGIKASLKTVKLTPEAIAMQLSSPDVGYAEDAAKERKYSTWDLKLALPADKAKEMLTAMRHYLAVTPIVPASTAIGADVAGDTQMVAVLAIVASWAGIILYLWVRFQGVAFGLAAVVALVHDILMMLGGIAISLYAAPYLGFLLVDEFKINLPIVAAFLTIVGYSVNDTIVVFDRIREIRGKDPMLTRKMVNESTNQTLSRTLLTSLTVAIVVFVLYIWGGSALHGFAFALVIGVITGTYSSIYIAAPILLWLVGKHKHAA